VCARIKKGLAIDVLSSDGGGRIVACTRTIAGVSVPAATRGSSSANAFS
jgi:hypothetical protein